MAARYSILKALYNQGNEDFLERSLTMSIESRTYPHSMLREIYEQPDAITRTLEFYLEPGLKSFKSGAMAEAAKLICKQPHLVIVASGSSRHAGLAAEILLEDLAGIAVDVEYASEYACRSTSAKIDPACPVMVLSQSGETADTLAALREAARRGHPTIAVTNVPNSTMSREANISLPTLAGKELAIPATKSFTTQLVVVALLALSVGSHRGVIDDEALAAHLEALAGIPGSLARQLPEWETVVEGLAPVFRDAKTFLYLGRGVHYAMAREGALKLKESSYLHAEGYPTGELKHGPNALVSAEVPLVVVATVDKANAESALRYEKTVTLLEDMQKQGARSVALVNTGDIVVPGLVGYVVEVDAEPEGLFPITEVVPLQLFAYFTAVMHGIDVDRPRNLSKAVLAE